METQTGLGATTQGQLRRKTSQNWSYNAIMFSVVLTKRTCPTTPASTTSTLSGSLSPLPFSCFPLSYSPYFRGQFSRFHIRDYQGRYFSTGRGKTNILWNGWAGQGWGVLKILRSQIEIYDGTSRDLWIQNPFVGWYIFTRIFELVQNKYCDWKTSYHDLSSLRNHISWIIWTSQFCLGPTV